MAEEPCSERFSDLPKATQQEEADLGFPLLLLVERLTCPQGSLNHPTLQVPPELLTGRSGKARTMAGSQYLAWDLAQGSCPRNAEFLIKSDTSPASHALGWLLELPVNLLPLSQCPSPGIPWWSSG